MADLNFIPLTHNLDTSCPSDMGPSAKKDCVRPAVEAVEDKDDNDENKDEDHSASQAKGPTKKRKPAARLTTWKKVDLDNHPLPEYQHFPPDFIETPSAGLSTLTTTPRSLEVGTIDGFFKVRPLFVLLVKAFRSEPQTPKQSVDVVIVAYKGKTAGNLR
ncbi:hypothetical protein F2P79_023843 [Pimephales promelas]|nr:hypothetical protein F2P79_023843 [Pimephales promelas]